MAPHRSVLLGRPRPVPPVATASFHGQTEHIGTMNPAGSATNPSPVDPGRPRRPSSSPPQPAGGANDDQPWLHSWPRAIPRLTWRLNACGGGRSERGWQELDSRRRILIRCKRRGGQRPWPGSTHPLSNPGRSCWIACGMRSAPATTPETPKMGRSADSGRPAHRPGPVWRTRGPEGPSSRYAAGRSAYHHPSGTGWETGNPRDGSERGLPAPETR